MQESKLYKSIGDMDKPFVAIIDYGLGNLFSIKQACLKVGLPALITSSNQEISESDSIILTGVGAFGRAIESLTKLDLVGTLREYANSGRPVIGICLGMQLLMTESYEFGCHRGLNLIEGKVTRLKAGTKDSKLLKVPHIGWNQIYFTNNVRGTLLEGIPDVAQMYFVHSYFAEPADKGVILSTTNYGCNEFCSSIRLKNISAFQFHPECSGPEGLKIYENLSRQILKEKRDDICLKS